MSQVADPLDAIRYSPFHRLVYVKNQKAGCTSIEYSLWTDQDRKTGRRTFRGKTHDRRSPVLGGPAALRGESAEVWRGLQVFTVVRNPFSRILSAYLHHVFDANLGSRLTRRLGLWRSADIRRMFFAAVGTDPGKSLTFEAFVERLVDTPPERLTGHFRPQVANILWGRLSYDFLGRLEDPEPLSRFFAAHDIAFRKRAPHAQGAADKLARFYSEGTRARVAAHFAADFQAFGYDPGDPASEVLRPLADAHAGRSLREFLAAEEAL